MKSTESLRPVRTEISSRNPEKMYRFGYMADGRQIFFNVRSKEWQKSLDFKCYFTMEQLKEAIG